MTIKQRWDNLMHNQKLKKQLYDAIFGSETPTGKTFDIILMVFIIVSILITIFDSLIDNLWGRGTLVVLEYVLTIFFTVEYLARLYCSNNPKAYAKSFFGIIDLLSILPMYLGFFVHDVRFFIVLRSIRLIRVFRIFKLFSFLDEGYKLMDAIRQSFRKIFVFFLFVVILVICIGTIMYMIECREPDTPFTDIPTGIYWAIVTMTTVGYGDVTPVSAMGRFFSSLVMVLGYTVIAVPTGIVSASMIEVAKGTPKSAEERNCPNCGKRGHDQSASYCKYCGSPLESKPMVNPHEDIDQPQDDDILT